jgi:hypothetical protein
VEAEEIAETKLNRIQGSALRWPLFLEPLGKTIPTATTTKLSADARAGRASMVRQQILNVPLTTFGFDLTDGHL